MLLEELIRRYLKYSEVNHSKGTQSIYKTTTRYMLEIFGNFDIQKFKKDDLERYKELRIKKVSVVSVNKEMRSIKAILNFANEEELINNNPFLKVKQLKVSHTKRKALNDEEVKILLKTINNKLIRNIAIVGLATACRLNEILWLRWRNIDLNSDIPVLSIENSDDFKTKNHENRTIPICYQLKEVLNKILKGSLNKKDREDFVFPNEVGRPYNKSYVSRQFKKFILKSGLNTDFHFHCLRHTAITNLAKNNNNYKVIKEIAGHSNITTTMGYVHSYSEDKFKALSTLTYFNLKKVS